MEFFYAQIDLQSGRVISVSSLAGEVNAANMIRLNNLDYSLIGKIYTGEYIFIDDPNPPEIPPEPPSELEQRLADLEMAIAAILGGAM